MLRLDVSKIMDALQDTPTKAEIAIKMYATEGAKKFQNYAKTHKRWINRTGHAQQRLVGFVETQNDKTKVCIAHGVNYGYYLEMCYEQKYAILNETVEMNSKEVLEGYENLMNKL